MRASGVIWQLYDIMFTKSACQQCSLELSVHPERNSHAWSCYLDLNLYFGLKTFHAKLWCLPMLFGLKLTFSDLEPATVPPPSPDFEMDFWWFLEFPSSQD